MYKSEDFQQLIPNFKNLNILVIGDLMLDKYIQGSVTRISPEAPVPVVKVETIDYRIGGAGNVAANLSSLQCNVTIAGILGNDEGSQIIQDIFKSQHIATSIIETDTRPTTVKTRIIAKHQQIVRIDEEVTDYITPLLQDALLEKISDNPKQFDGIIISDYSKGLLTQEYIARIENQFPNIPIIVDPKGHDYTKYQSATVIKPNWNEFKTAINQPDLQIQNIEKPAQQMVKDLNLEGIIITLGENGVFVLDNKGNSEILPTVALDVFDVSGAGDTFIAAFSAALLSSRNWLLASTMANIASGIVVGKLGTAVVSDVEILDNLNLVSNE